MIAPTTQATIPVEFSDQDRLQLRIQGNQKCFSQADLEKMEQVVQKNLPAFQNTESTYWKGSSSLEKVGYYVDFWKFGKNAKAHDTKVRNEQLLNKIQTAIQILRTKKESS